MPPQLIRISLNEDGTVHYIPWYADPADAEMGDYGQPMAPVAALSLLRAGVPAELACNDPDDLEHSHYETLGALCFTRI